MNRHGGDIYRNPVELDFSVNTNPLGMPEAVKTALREAVGLCDKYPDIRAGQLKKAVGSMLAVPQDFLLFGNGASELFMAIFHGIRPEKTVIPVPSFYGYEYAAKAAGGKVLYAELPEENAFFPGEELLAVLSRDVRLLFLANPNNPTGVLLDREYLLRLLYFCRSRGIYVVVDECFIEFCGNEFSLLQETKRFENLILVRAFTKSCSIPGVRLGYLVCGSRALLKQIEKQLPEWNLSTFAQAAGVVCARQEEYLKKTVDYVEEQRKFLTERLRGLGYTVYDSRANFILLYTRKPLYEELLKRGILIRDCRNFRGLRAGFYRIGVKSEKENERLLSRIGEIP